ncbi:MAG: biotin/lipoyl-containing protein [Cellulosilyticaceae bacterium]
MRKFQVTVNGNTYEVEVEEVGGGFQTAPTRPVAAPVAVAPVAQAPVVPAAAPSAAGANKVVAPMPGKIVDVKVSVGQQIKEGDLVAVLEAMKMENEVFASASGTVASVNVSAGAMVEANDVIVTIN